MTDRWPATLTIRKKDYQKEDVRALIDEEHLTACEDKNLIHLLCSETPEGKFSELEAYFLQQKIPFDRTSESWFQHPEQIRRYRPQTETSDVVDKTAICNEGDNLIPAYKIADIIRDASLSHVQMIDFLEELLSDNGFDIFDMDEF